MPPEDDVGRHSQFEWHDNGALMWTWRLTLVVSGSGLALLALSAVLWVELPAGPPAPVLAVIGFLALLVAVAGRITSGRALRYRDVPLPEMPPQTALAPVSQVRQRSFRRRSGFPYFMMSLMSGGTAFAAFVNWSSQPRVASVFELVLGVGFGMFWYLAGPAARFVVTPEYLRIDTAFRSISVPRHLIAEFSKGAGELRVDLTNGDRIYFRVDSPLLDRSQPSYRNNDHTQIRTMERIVAMLREVPSAAVDGGIVVRWRWGMIVLAVVAAVVAIGSVAALVNVDKS